MNTIIIDRVLDREGATFSLRPQTIRFLNEYVSPANDHGLQFIERSPRLFIACDDFSVIHVHTREILFLLVGLRLPELNIEIRDPVTEEVIFTQPVEYTNGSTTANNKNVS